MDIVISLGGSLINPEKIDIDYLKKFSDVMRNYKGRSIIICGGGKVCRDYNNAASAILGHDPKPIDLDWMGIRATHINAELIRIILGDRAYESIVTEPKCIGSDKIIVGGGYLPGNSSDEPAIRMACANNITTVVNLTNVNGVYNKDPKKHPDATHFPKMTWDEFFDAVGNGHNPGQHSPFCPKAGALARDAGITVVIIDGKDIGNLKSLLAGKEYKGTKISTSQ